MTKDLCGAAFLFSSLLLIPSAVLAQPQQFEVLELKAANYDPVAGIWHDSSGNGNDAIALVSAPALTPGQTLNGSAVVTFDGATTYLTLTTGISSGNFTCVASVRHSQPAVNTIVGGNTGAFQYRIGGNFQGQQEVLVRNIVNLAHSTTIVDPTVFSTVSVGLSSPIVNYTFRLDETDDPTIASPQFSAPTDTIGAAPSGSSVGEFYGGDIAEIRLYNTVLSETDRAAVEEEIRTTYEP
jgi:hypothetical protein